MAAGELVRRGVNVTMLDAGWRPVRGVLLRAGDITIFRWSEDRLRYDRASMSGDPGTTWGSCLSLGGLSNYWTAAVPRMSPDDFSEGARLDDRFRWPITYEDLVPFYELVERRMTITAGDPIGGVPSGFAAYRSAVHPEWADQVRWAAQSGQGMGALPMAKGRPWMGALRPTAFTSYHQLIKPLLREPRFRLIRGATAVGIKASSAGDEAAVDYITGDTHERRVIRSRAVVVAAGTVDSTRLLLRSRSHDFPDGLGNSSGILGRYLHDHPKQWWLARLGRPMPVLTHPLYLAREPLGVDAPLMASSLTLGLEGSLTRLKGWTGGRSDVIGVQVFGTMVPSEEFGVKLVDDGPGDDAGAGVDVAIRYDEQALHNMERARDRLAVTLAAGGLDAQPMGPFHRNSPRVVLPLRWHSPHALRSEIRGSRRVEPDLRCLERGCV